MKRMAITMMVGLGFLLAGCGKKAGDDHAGHDHSGHDHAEHDHAGHDHAGHDHAGHDHSHGHGHHHEPPHGGSLNVLGSELAHLEFVHKADLGELTCYVLDGHAEKGIALPVSELTFTITADGQSFDVVLPAKPNELSGETAENSSQFVGVDPRLKGQPAFLITAKEITVKGIKFTNVEMPYPEGNEGH